MSKVIDGYSPVESTTARATGTGVEYNWDKRYIGYKTGWVCPVCGRVNAPWMLSCACRSVAVGKWIPVTNDRGGHKCNICGAYASSWATGEEHLTNYCPNCGVRMDGDVNETD